MSEDERESVEKMRAEGLDEVAVASFAQQLERLRAGEHGMLPEADIEPMDKLPALEELADGDGDGGAGEALDRTAVIKLNGGLGTSMGMSGPKSLLEAKDGLTFLDISVRQVKGLRERTGARLPLVLMNSFATREPSLEALRRHGDVSGDLPPDFLQGRVPKLRADDLRPVDWPDDPALEWAPPGHGDLYASLLSSGMLEVLLERDYAYAFVSNVDNLGAVVDPRILGWLAREEIPFLLEVARRTEADRKGGHLARRPDGGGLALREIAQTPEEDLDAFQDIERHRYFNTNTLWVDLRALRRVLDERDGVLGLPMIVNRKTVDPADKGSPPVIQLETAMGAAIDVFEGARAVCVPRARLAPVKTTNDLLVLRSDAYDLDEQGAVIPARPRDPVVDLDADHFKALDDFEARFPAGPPSLRECDRLTVAGDVTFGAGVVARGTVRVEGPTHIDDGAVLDA